MDERLYKTRGSFVLQFIYVCPPFYWLRIGFFEKPYHFSQHVFFQQFLFL